MADFNQHSSGKTNPKITTTSPKFCNFLVRNIFLISLYLVLFLHFYGLENCNWLGLVRLLQQRLLCPALLVLAFFIWEAYQNNNVSEVILALIYIGVVGLLLDKFMAWIETRIVPQEQR